MTKRFAAFALSALLAAAAAAPAAELNEADLAALRYFLSIDDQASVRAEIERLETEFPGADVQGALALIDARATEVDTSPVWRRIEADDYAAARALIAELRAEHPDWAPPAEMVEILDGREGQAAFEAAVAAADLAAAIDALARFPVILTCERINNPWRLAELQVAAGLDEDALKTYEGVLESCRQPDYVVATLQKAHEIAEAGALDALFAVARARNPALAPRLAELATELQGPAGEGGESAGAAPATAGAPAAASRSPAPATAQAAPAAAAAAAPRRATAAAASAGGGGQLARARAAADRGDWGACLEATTNARSVEEINQRAWCTLNFGRARESIEHFRRVAANSRDGAMVRDAQYGQVLAYAQIGQLEQAAAIAQRTQLTAQQRQVVNRTIYSKLAVSSFEAGRYRQTLDYLDRVSRDTGTLDRGLAMLRGWALLKSGQRWAAGEQFRRIHAASPGNDSLQGIIESR